MMQYKIMNRKMSMYKFISIILILATAITARAEFVTVPEGKNFKPSLHPETAWAEVIEFREVQVRGVLHYDVTYRYGNEVAKVLTKFRPNSRILVMVSVVPVTERW